jgi:hypothetical protein
MIGAYRGSVIMLSVIMLSVIMLNVVMLSAFKLSVIMLWSTYSDLSVGLPD